MSEDDNSAPANKDKDSTLLLTKDGQRYYVNKSGVVDSRNVITPQETESNAFSYDMDDPDEESDVLDTSDPRDSAASPEELNDEDVSEGDNAPKQCTYEGCTETTTQVAKQRKPWMCKKHRNKMYKDKYKKKKSDQAMSSGKLDVKSCCIDKLVDALILDHHNVHDVRIPLHIHCTNKQCNSQCNSLDICTHCNTGQYG